MLKANAEFQPAAPTCCWLLFNLGQCCESSATKSGLRKSREALESKWRDAGHTRRGTLNHRRLNAFIPFSLQLGKEKWILSFPHGARLCLQLFARGIRPVLTQAPTHAIRDFLELWLQVWWDPDISFTNHVCVMKRFHTTLLPTCTPSPCSLKLTTQLLIF